MAGEIEVVKHGKYSKLKEVKPYKDSVIVKRYDGISLSEYFCSSEDNAKNLVELFKSFEPCQNEFYFETEYKIEFIGNKKLI